MKNMSDLKSMYFLERPFFVYFFKTDVICHWCALALACFSKKYLLEKRANFCL